ncbi:MAG: GFA family protein [Reyranella sp.]|uniref:GFA family protein n=1 Tax=Reyranella sp. TaxID=1929291 RepID=UPI001AC1F2E6|nr:GFA family protein [Reyranella sp.]MBN9086845.1 GFA family protein [Reyranella sp.]
MTVQRQAACHCGQLRVRLHGDPVLVSSCHCRACQRRTGAVFGSTSFFWRYQVVAIEGEHRTWRRAGDSGRWLTFHFCPTCGSNVFWEAAHVSNMLSVAVGAFADPTFPAPSRTVWCESKHGWLPFPDSIPSHPKSSA